MNKEPKKKKIIIAIDHKWRDLPGFVYIKKLLEKRGYEVYLTRMQFDYVWVKLLNADALIGIHLYDDKKRKRYEELHKNGTSIFLMPTEGIPTLSTNKELLLHFAGADIDLSGVDIQFTWNNLMKKLAEENKTMNGRPVIAVGVPRFDFYRSPLNKLLMTRKEFNKKYKIKNNFPIITLATNFTHASFYNTNYEFVREDWKRLKIDKFLDMDDYIRGDYMTRKTTLESVRKLLKDFPKSNFILKLHPSEDQTFYNTYFSQNELERIRIIKQEYIWDILNITNILLKRSCTTGIEAWFLGLPTIEMRLNPDDIYYSPEHAKGSDEVHNYEELYKMIEYYLNDGKVSEPIKQYRDEFVSKWCYKIDGKSSIRFVSIIDDFLKRQEKKPVQSSSLYEKTLYHILKLTDYKLHDIKVYGLFSKKDKLGRFDKYIHRSDINYWEDKLKDVC